MLLARPTASRAFAEKEPHGGIDRGIPKTGNRESPLLERLCRLREDYNLRPDFVFHLIAERFSFKRQLRLNCVEQKPARIEQHFCWTCHIVAAPRTRMAILTSMLVCELEGSNNDVV